MNNVYGLLEDYSDGEPLNEGRMQIALDEFPCLIGPLERLAEEAKKRRWAESVDPVAKEDKKK